MAGSLHDRLALLNAELLGAVVDDLPDVLENAQPQDRGAATYARKISPGEAEIDWTRPAAELALRSGVRAVPGATSSGGARGQVRVLKAHAASGAGTPVAFLALMLMAGCRSPPGRGADSLSSAAAGSKPMAASAFLNGARLTPGANSPATPAGSGAERVM